jgi:hypothetical protein
VRGWVVPSKVRYEVYFRPKSKDGKRKGWVMEAGLPARKWQFAMKLAARLKAKGHPEVVVREVTVTHEHRVGAPA